MIPNKQEFLKMVYEQAAVKDLFSQIKSSKEERTNKAAVDELVGNFYESVLSIVSEVQKDPEGFKKSVSEFEDDLIKEEGSSEIVVVEVK